MIDAILQILDHEMSPLLIGLALIIGLGVFGITVIAIGSHYSDRRVQALLHLATIQDERRYNVMTWDAAAQQYTDEEGGTDLDWKGMLAKLRQLRGEGGYDAGRGDPSILVERTDDAFADELMEALKDL